MPVVVVLAVAAACGSSKPATRSPPPPTCAAAADHVLTLIEPRDDHARKIRDIFQLRCERDVWGGDVRACIVSTASLKDPKNCKARLTPAQRAVLDRELAEADRVARAGRIPAHCERYRELIEKLMTCDKLPQASREALKQGYDAMSEGWKNMQDMPDEARRAMDDGCRMGADALMQAVGAMCGWGP